MAFSTPTYKCCWVCKTKHYIGAVNVIILLACLNRFWKTGRILPNIFTKSLTILLRNFTTDENIPFNFQRKYNYWKLYTEAVTKSQPQIKNGSVFPNASARSFNIFTLSSEPSSIFVLYVILIQIRFNSPISYIFSWKIYFQDWDQDGVGQGSGSGREGQSKKVRQRELTLALLVPVMVMVVAGRC